MEINLNIILDVTPELEDLVERVVAAIESQSGEDNDRKEDGSDAD